MKIVITAGGTSERIDDVRTITNSSTGSLGFAIGTAFAAEEKIEKIYYLHGKRAVWPEDEKVVPIEIGGVMDLKDSLTKVLTEEKIDAVIHAMAVSDYMVHQVTTLDKLMGTDGICRLATIGFYSANEAMSIIENASKIGVPFPASLLDFLRRIRDKNNGAIGGDHHSDDEDDAP